MKNRRLKVLIAASEAAPFAKVGGLGDVVGTLPKFLARQGHDVRVVIPRYAQVDKKALGLKQVDGALAVPMGLMGTVHCAALEGRLPGTDVPIYFIEHNAFFDRHGGLYTGPDGQGYMDNDNRFVFLSRAALELCRMLDFRPDVAHCHDWQTSAIPLFLKTVYANDPVLGGVPSLLTIHNMQHQGDFYPGLMDVLGISWENFNPSVLEFYAKVNLLRGGLTQATLINAVSPTYAHEIMTPEWGYGLETSVIARQSDLYGILNGVDYDEWDPGTDPHIAANYSARDLSGKAACKADLQKTFGLPQRPDVPVLGVVSRLVHQKGVDVLAAAMPGILKEDVQFVLVGTGEPWAHAFFKTLAKDMPKKCSVHIGYDNVRAHKVEAGADVFLMPSRFEPCGLNQLYSMRYGTLPVVRAVGGLNDTVENFGEDGRTGTGFKFKDLTPEALTTAVIEALRACGKPDILLAARLRAMSRRFTWEDSAAEYAKLYRLAAARAKA